ncbi:MAG: proprotein convertase P-domain-containing protein [Kofleriaceae bacterium]|nr:proprotein convertase P-domain-containing protein [Kofleriaceae bacterium]
MMPPRACRPIAGVVACVALGACAAADVGSDAGPIDAAAPADGPRPDAGPGEVRSLLDDTAVQLGAGASVLDQTTIQDRGAIEPVGYYTGGLLQRGSDSGTFAAAASATWSGVLGFTATAKTAIEWRTQESWGTATPPSVGLTDGDTFTQWWQGEIKLAAGTWTFRLLADDHGFVEVAEPGTTGFSRVVSADWPNATSGTFVAAAAGWYPIRYATSEATGSAQVDLQLAGPGLAQQPIPRDWLRARVDDVPGLLEIAFDDSRGCGDVETTVDAVGPGNTDWGTGNPGDLALTSPDTFSVRWTGQVWIEVGGAYTFRLATDDGQRLWIDGVKLLDAWDDTAHDVQTSPITLDVGWHDVVIDHSENTVGAAATLTVAGGPDLTGQVLPVARLRPVEGRGDRLAPAVSHTDVTILDNGQTDVTLDVTGFTGAVVTRVDVAYSIDHPRWGDLAVSLLAPDGTSHVLRDHVGGVSSGTFTQRATLTTLAGAPVAGTWRLRVYDSVTGGTGTVLDVAVTPHYSGGEPPVPTTSSYLSTVRDLGDARQVLGVDAVDWEAGLPAGAAVAVRVRTCELADACAATPWGDVVTEPGGDPGVGPARYLQYRVDFTSDGDHTPSLEWLRIDYRVAP